ncbi:MAG TPA: outer membrane beta-barrel protein [Vicinamibacteria bacterium]|nr:outer membrane beta-barrel protein [Vicinamibacteria bacterium]
MRANLLIPVTILLASAQAAATGSANRGELFAGIGASRVGSDEGSLGSGPYVLGGVGFRLATRASVEVDAFRAQHEREIAGGPLEGTATGVLGNVVYRFSEGRTQVFVMGSAGLLRSETTHTYPVRGTLTTFRSEDNGFAWGGGGGVKIFLTPRFSLRPQLRLVFSEATGVMGLAAASIGIGYHW